MFWTICITLFIVWALSNKSARKWMYIVYKTLPRDVKAAIIFVKVNYKLHKLAKQGESIPKLFTRIAKEHPNKVAFHFEDQKWTFQELEDFSNKVANYFRQEGYQPGDSIALLLENRPDYVGLWLGLSKIGVITALINTNLVSGPLIHSVSAAQSTAIIYGSEFENAINGIRDKIKEIKLFRYNTSDVTKLIDHPLDLNVQLENASKSSPTDSISRTKTSDKIIYIYTSGTTGLPKAANITHARFLFGTVALYIAADLNSEDIFYNPLPLYHSSGGMVGAGQTLVYGMTSAIRKKFSASNFWIDCKKYNCTVTNYIGEICRYLLASHNNNRLVDHNVKKMTGNGLRKDIWKEFQETFKISKIFEFYGSTEGNANLVNIDNTVGAVGFIPRYANWIYPLSLIKCDEETKQPLRNKNGACTRCNPGEPGILIGKINQKNAVNEFTGYADKTETNKKIISGAFKKGDLYFNTGDIMVQDELGYFYFKDRTGDTFRWKGENVATNEVESVITGIIGVKEIVVYGVEVPNTEGKAGMVTILDPDRTTDIETLGRSLKSQLPSYAIPKFLRLGSSLPMTGTFKVKKMELQKDGFDLNKIKDPLYFYEASTSTYIPLRDLYEDIMSGKKKL